MKGGKTPVPEFVPEESENSEIFFPWMIFQRSNGIRAFAVFQEMEFPEFPSETWTFEQQLAFAGAKVDLRDPQWIHSGSTARFMILVYSRVYFSMMCSTFWRWRKFGVFILCFFPDFPISKPAWVWFVLANTDRTCWLVFALDKKLRPLAGSRQGWSMSGPTANVLLASHFPPPSSLLPPPSFLLPPPSLECVYCLRSGWIVTFEELILNKLVNGRADFINVYLSFFSSILDQ